MTIEELDLPLEQLGEVGRPGGIARFRADAAKLAWTFLAPFDAFALNVFAPTRHIFWNLYVYAALENSEFAYHARFLIPERRAGTHDLLKQIIRSAGHKIRSDFSSLLLGAWTATPDFFPEREGSEVSFRSHRHRSMLVPAADRLSVSEHFAQQASVFGGTSFARLPDSFHLSDFDDLRATLEWRVLNDYFPESSSEQQREILSAAQHIIAESSLDAFANSLDPRFAVKGLFSLFPVPRNCSQQVDMEGYAEVLRFRAQVARMVCPLHRLEVLARDVSNAGAGNEDVYPLDSRDEILGALRQPLIPVRPMIDFELPTVAASKLAAKSTVSG